VNNKLKALLIAEKPSLMIDIQKVYNKFGYHDDIHFTTFVGHTMTLKQPQDYNVDWAKWKLETLPMIPAEFQYVPSKDKLKLYNDVKKELTNNHYDYVINACDPGREGQAIFHSFYDSLGLKIPVKRMWWSDLTEKELKKAFDNMQDYTSEKSLQRMTIASKYRAYFDWLIGMNGSRVVTLLTGKNTPVGRVMTPTLKILVDRELEIRNFVAKDFWEIEADFGSYKGLYYDHENENETKFTEKAKADALCKVMGGESVIAKVKKKQEIKYAPSLHSLQDLSNEANRTFGYTMAETLLIAQSLYEKKILSYPRTDSSHITGAIAKEFPKLLKSLLAIPTLVSKAEMVMKDSPLIQKTASNKKYVDDKKVTDHYAIIPTGLTVDMSKLTTKEQNIFTIVCKRFLSIFLPPLISNKTQIITVNNGHRFLSNGSVLESLGFMELYPYKSNDQLLPNVKEKDIVSLVGTNLLAKKTTPPKRYSDEMLGLALENAGKFVDDEDLASVLKESKGLGTPATRGSVIEKIVTLEMVERVGKGKVKVYQATEFGISIIEDLRDKDITLPEMTGIWESKLKDIEKGLYQAETFYQEMLDYTKAMVEDFKHTKMKVHASSTSSSSSSKEVIGTCPKCSSDVIEGKTFYLCTKYKNPCDFVVGKKIMGASISKTEMKKLLNGKQTKELTFTWKSLNKGNASLILDDQGNTKFVFSDNKDKSGNKSSKVSSTTSKSSSHSPTSNQLGTCPICSKPVIGVPNGYLCEGKNNGCTFFIAHTVRGGKILEKDIKLLLAGKETNPILFTWTSGKSSNAKLKWSGTKLDFIFS